MAQYVTDERLVALYARRAQYAEMGVLYKVREIDEQIERLTR